MYYTKEDIRAAVGLMMSNYEGDHDLFCCLDPVLKDLAIDMFFEETINELPFYFKWFWSEYDFVTQICFGIKITTTIIKSPVVPNMPLIHTVYKFDKNHDYRLYHCVKNLNQVKSIIKDYIKQKSPEIIEAYLSGD